MSFIRICVCDALGVIKGWLKCVIIVNELRQPLSGTVWANLPMLSHKEPDKFAVWGSRDGRGDNISFKIYIFCTSTHTYIHICRLQRAECCKCNLCVFIHLRAHTRRHTQAHTHIYRNKMREREKSLVKMCNVDPTPFSFCEHFCRSGRSCWRLSCVCPVCQDAARRFSFFCFWAKIPNYDINNA